MSVILKYYLGNLFDEIIEDIFTLIDKSINYELGNITNIFTDYKTITTSVFLESTLAESGLSLPIVHSKYNYCHGRSTLNKDKDYDSIYLINNNLNPSSEDEEYKIFENFLVSHNLLI